MSSYLYWPAHSMQFYSMVSFVSTKLCSFLAGVHLRSLVSILFNDWWSIGMQRLQLRMYSRCRSSTSPEYKSRNGEDSNSHNDADNNPRNSTSRKTTSCIL